MENNKTSWSDMSHQMLNTWSSMGTQMWKNWFDLMGSVNKPPAPPTAQPGFEQVTQQFFNNQQLMTRLLQLSYDTWRDLFPKVEAGQDWQQAMAQYNQQIRSQMEAFSNSSLKVYQDATDLWQLYLQEWQKVSQLWMASMGEAIGPLSQVGIGHTSEPWLELNNLYWNLLYEESFGSLMQSPLLGPSREFNGKLLRNFDAWSKLYRATLDYQVVLTTVQTQSFERLMRELVTMAEQGKTVQDWREFQQLWSRVADDVFEQAFCDENNLKVRGRFLNALNVYRLHQQDLMEMWMKSFNVPSRSEVDEVHRSLYELRKEIKHLKKQLAHYESQPATTRSVPPLPDTPAPAPVLENRNATTSDSAAEIAGGLENGAQDSDTSTGDLPAGKTTKGRSPRASKE
ncbi:MAG: class III poly(R)-hydroxyalkanoic acid synthase subunit PhaE [Leptolyngbyaceae cyanobacterium]